MYKEKFVAEITCNKCKKTETVEGKDRNLVQLSLYKHGWVVDSKASSGKNEGIHYCKDCRTGEFFYPKKGKAHATTSAKTNY